MEDRALTDAHACCPVDEPSARDPRFRVILWVALVINLSMFVVEVIAGHIADSASLLADALDFFGDSANYAISLFVFSSVLVVRSKAAIVKAASMGAFGVWVLVTAVMRAISGSNPEPLIMSSIGLLALVANVFVAYLLYQYRTGDSNMRSVWLCTRNDAIGNLAVLAAALGVATTASRWPDLAVALLIGALSLSSAVLVLRLALTEIRENAH